MPSQEKKTIGEYLFTYLLWITTGAVAALLAKFSGWIVFAIVTSVIVVWDAFSKKTKTAEPFFIDEMDNP